MKKLVLLAVAFVFVTGSILVGTVGYVHAKNVSATGKVTAIDPDGLGIVIAAKAGEKELTVGAIIGKETIFKSGGKKIAPDQIKVGDTATVVYEKSTDLFAKEIIKK